MLLPPSLPPSLLAPAPPRPPLRPPHRPLPPAVPPASPPDRRAHCVRPRPTVQCATWWVGESSQLCPDLPAAPCCPTLAPRGCTASASCRAHAYAHAAVPAPRTFPAPSVRHAPRPPAALSAALPLPLSPPPQAPEVERCPLKYFPDDNKDNPSLAYTTAADIWSVGILAYELLVGVPPLLPTTAPPPSFHHAHHAHGPERAVLSFPASVSAAARDLITWALSPRPEDRPTAVQLLQHPWLAAAAAGPKPGRRQELAAAGV